MPEKTGFLNDARRFFQEMTGELVFVYNPTSESWKRNPDGSITIGKEQVLAAIEITKAFKENGGKEQAEKAQTVIGLSVAYLKKHYPQALKDAKYDE